MAPDTYSKENLVLACKNFSNSSIELTLRHLLESPHRGDSNEMQ